MINLKQIITKNHETYYNYNTRERISQKKRIFLQCVLAIILTLLFGQIKNDLLNSVLTIYSILIGFSFSILFYLLGSNRRDINAIQDDASNIDSKNKEQAICLEDLNKSEKLQNLTTELFYNVSHFNLVSVLIILFSLIFIIIQSNGPLELTFIIELIVKYELADTLKYIFQLLRYLFISLFFALLIESIYSFVRIIDRINYLFGETILNDSK